MILILGRFFRVGWLLDTVAMLYRIALLIGLEPFLNTLTIKVRKILLEYCLSVCLMIPKMNSPPEEPYELSISIVYIIDKDEYGEMAVNITSSLKKEFPNLLEKTKDSGTVDLRKREAVSEMEFTVRDMRDTVEYHLRTLKLSY